MQSTSKDTKQLEHSDIVSDSANWYFSKLFSNIY